jgi:hypothetical protein
MMASEPLSLVSFDVDETLEYGDPPGPVAKAALLRLVRSDCPRVRGSGRRRS